VIGNLRRFEKDHPLDADAPDFVLSRPLDASLSEEIEIGEDEVAMVEIHPNDDPQVGNGSCL
jgi:hypothetical protein